MSIKSLIQIVIIIIIFIIIGGVYYKYFLNNELITEETIEQSTTEETLEQSTIAETSQLTNQKQESESIVLTNAEDNNLANKKTIENNKSNKVVKNYENEIQEPKTEKNLKSKSNQKKIKVKKQQVENLVKEVEYLTTDNKGNKYKIFATSGKTNQYDKDVLDLNDVKGIISSEKRSNIYFVADFAEYNSSNQSSKFYQNVVINYDDKQITCDNFDIVMESNLAIAYSNVIITDPKSIMKAGKVTLDIETKDININPDENETKVKVITN